MSFAKDIISQAKKLKKRIVFPEADDPRIIAAASALKKKGIVEPVLIGNPIMVEKIAKENKISLSNVEVIYPEESEHLEAFAKELFELRHHKGMILSQAREIVQEPIYYGAMLVRKGHADGLISGAAHATKHTVKAALQVVGTREGVKVASSMFFMEFPKEVLIFADCGFVIDPDSDALAEIAVETAKTTKLFGMEPRVAMLSFSTKGSAQHDHVTKVVDATNKVKELDSSILIDGEMQFDAAYVPGVQKKKSPESALGGKPANVFIFPDLNSGNISYKIAQRLGGAKAFGPIMQGFKAPVNDLSRGCSADDVIVVAAITAVQSSKNL